MEPARFRAIQAYVDFDEETSATLARLLPLVESHLPLLVDDFYDAIRRDPNAQRVITGGDNQVHRLKATLLNWLRTLLSGPHDEQYLETRSRIGRVHVRINLSQEYMLTAIDRVRNGLIALAESKLPSDQVFASILAINKALDIELALMLDTYRHDWNTRVDASARLAAIGQIAASIGHELRNPLGVVESSIYLMNQRLQKTGYQDDVFDKHLKRIQDQVTLCASTISSLLDMAREAPLRRTHFALHELVSSVCAEVCHPPELKIQVDVDADLMVLADRQQLARVLSNLMRNAVEAIDGAGQIVLGAASARGGVELWVEDDGPGVPESNRQRIFDVLFTTRAKGTGLGLALCKKILDRHGGELILDQKAERGARFLVWLPNQVQDE